MTIFPDAYIPYCGLPPLPGSVSWNLDPVLIGVLGGLAAGHLWLLRRKGHAGDRQCIAGAGWGIVALALISPLCSLSVALFSARVTQHVIMTLIAAPLLAYAGRPARPRQAGRQFEAITAPLAFAVFMWLWHMPGAYDATLKSDLIYWTMHVTLFGAALWFWRVLLDGRILGPGGALLASLATGFQMSILGAVLALNGKALFAVHFATTQPWGLTPLQDQQIGGMIMWVPAGILLTGYAILAFAAALRKMDAEDGVPFS